MLLPPQQQHEDPRQAQEQPPVGRSQANWLPMGILDMKFCKLRSTSSTGMRSTRAWARIPGLDQELHPPNQYGADGKRFPVARRDQGRRAGSLPGRHSPAVLLQAGRCLVDGNADGRAITKSAPQTFKTAITPAQSMNLLTSRKEASRSWPEHFLFLVAMSDACGGAASLVLNNIVQYVCEELRTVQMAKYDHARVDHLRQDQELAHFDQSVEIDTDTVAYRRQKNASKPELAMAGEVGHLRAHCTSNSANGKSSGKAIRKSKVYFTVAVEETGSGSDLWILDSGSSTTWSRATTY